MTSYICRDGPQKTPYCAVRGGWTEINIPDDRIQSWGQAHDTTSTHYPIEVFRRVSSSKLGNECGNAHSRPRFLQARADHPRFLDPARQSVACRQDELCV